MVLELLVGLNVTDDQSYQRYREGMTPILKSYGGGFSNDFRIEEVLKSKTEAPINRVFTIFFPDRAAKDRFFADEQYLQVKARFYDVSVQDTTILASYERSSD